MQEPGKSIDRVSPPASGWTNSRRAIAVSVLVHLVLIGALLCWYVPSPTPSENGSRPSSSAVSAMAGSDNSAPLPPSPPDVNVDVPPQQIEASIASQVESVEKLSDQRKLTELEKNLARLQAIATDESVRDVTATIADSLGLEPGPVPAEQPPDGELDPETAQIHDVTRVLGDSGQWVYESVLVDARGRTQTVPLNQAEGEAAYRTFEQLKRYPMAAGIYRQLVMPMLQKMIQASALTEQAAREARQMQSESAVLSENLNQPEGNP